MPNFDPDRPPDTPEGGSPEIRRPDPCGVCRRAKSACICASHTPLRHLDATADVSVMRVVRRPYPQEHIEVLVNEGMHHYYNRDAEGLARWLRRHLP